LTVDSMKSRSMIPSMITFSSVSCCAQPFASMSRDQFVAMLDNKAVETFVQPIVCLPMERVIGYLALPGPPGIAG
jgi:hypothetical protein